MAEQALEGSQPVDLKKHPSGIVPTLQWVPFLFCYKFIMYYSNIYAPVWLTTLHV